MGENKQYLGDGVYVEKGEFSLTLTTEDGERTSNTIYLEPAVFSALVGYEKTMRD